MKMDTFINASYVGEDAARMAHEKATIGTFQGAPLKISNLLTAPAAGQHDNVLFWHKRRLHSSWRRSLGDCSRLDCP
ncbi:MAG: hypothetical protein IPI85_15505 [Dehalococcoidia bacterium]|nr:hypothetical protein [Dehalococcoidia bacterium]